MDAKRKWHLLLLLSMSFAAAVIVLVTAAQRPRRFAPPWAWFPACPVSPLSQDIPDEGRLTLKEIVGKDEARHVGNAVCSPYVSLLSPMRYKRTEKTTTIHVPEISTNSFTAGKFLSGEAYDVETDTFMVLTIDKRTGKILIPEGTPSLSRRELDDICRPLLKGSYAEEWEVWMDSVYRVSDWYVVHYRRQKLPLREGDKYFNLIFWINARTKRAANDGFFIEYADS